MELRLAQKSLNQKSLRASGNWWQPTLYISDPVLVLGLVQNYPSLSHCIPSVSSPGQNEKHDISSGRRGREILYINLQQSMNVRTWQMPAPIRPAPRTATVLRSEYSKLSKTFRSTVMWSKRLVIRTYFVSCLGLPNLFFLHSVCEQFEYRN
jgi:hypothetical protein